MHSDEFVRKKKNIMLRALSLLMIVSSAPAFSPPSVRIFGGLRTFDHAASSCTQGAALPLLGLRREAGAQERRPLAVLFSSRMDANLFNTVNDGVKEAMKSKDKERLQALRGIKSVFQSAAKDKGVESLSDEECIAALRKLAKQRQESIEAYTKAGRTDLVAAETRELNVINLFVPALADADTTRTWVMEAIAESGATSVSMMGKVMGVLMKKHKADMDAALAKTIVEDFFKNGGPPAAQQQPAAVAPAKGTQPHSSADNNKGGREATPKAVTSPEVAAVNAPVKESPQMLADAVSSEEDTSTSVDTRGAKTRAAKNRLERADPEYRAVLARQKLLTEAMDILTKYDEAQADFQALYADSNAPLGDWCGYHKRLTAAEREAMRDACKRLSQEASYVLIGLNANNLPAAREALQQWLTGLDLPVPDTVPYTDDNLRQDYGDLTEMPEELKELFAGPVHMCYNSIAGANEETGDDTGFPPAAHVMPYPAGDRGVVFTPILEGFFTQYGDVPLDLFDLAADALAPTAEEAAAEVSAGKVQGDPDIATKQHAALGNAMAAKALADKAKAASQDPWARAMGA